MYEYIHINSRPRVCSNIIDIQKDLDSGRRESRHNITKEGVGISRQVGGGGGRRHCLHAPTLAWRIDRRASLASTRVLPNHPASHALSYCLWPLADSSSTLVSCIGYVTLDVQSSCCSYER